MIKFREIYIEKHRFNNLRELIYINDIDIEHIHTNIRQILTRKKIL